MISHLRMAKLSSFWALACIAIAASSLVVASSSATAGSLDYLQQQLQQQLPSPTSIHELFPVDRTEDEINRRSPFHYRNIQSNSNSNSINSNIGGHAQRNDLDSSLQASSSASGTEITPLYPGYGTHFSYIYIGTPPQRQSVIVDTGSHYTAFPCTGCSQCGAHTDNYWDPALSTSDIVPKCGSEVCSISQSYSEGSSWKAYKVQDKLWVSGLSPNVVPNADSFGVDFTFGCQTYETGLFRTQLADGIMGMSMDEATLPFVMSAQGVTSSKLFALCYRVGGGIMTLGGVDQRIHTNPRETIKYAKLLQTSGWFQVKLVDIQMEDRSSGGGAAKSIGEDASKYNSGKGCIVDSGTTDTYLPSSISAKFTALFKEITGLTFSQANIAMTTDQLKKLPNLLFVFEDLQGETFQISMPYDSYVDSVGGGKYAFRIYLTEPSGTVLGANFMNNYNVIFDADNGRLGFARSTCQFEDFSIPPTNPPTAEPSASPTRVGDKPTKPNPIVPSPTPGTSSGCLTAVSECSARCTAANAYIATGTQAFDDRCGVGGNLTTYTRDCGIACNNGIIVRGYSSCPEKPWSECSKECSQNRDMPSTDTVDDNVSKNLRQMQLGSYTDFRIDAAKCKYIKQTRSCYSGSCPIINGDYLVFIDMRVQKINPMYWSYVHTEDFYAALSRLFMKALGGVLTNSIELMNDASAEYALGTKLHFQIRIKRSDYKSVAALTNAAQNIAESVWDPLFPRDLLRTLIEVSTELASQSPGSSLNGLYGNASSGFTVGLSRYGFLSPGDVDILNAMAMPMGDVRAETDDIANEGVDHSIYHELEDKYNNFNRIDLILAGVAIVSVVVMIAILICYCRLKTQHSALENERVASGSLLRKWMRYMQGSGDHSSRHGGGSGGGGDGPMDRTGLRYAEIQMSEYMDDDGFDNEFDNNSNSNNESSSNNKGRK